MKNGHPILFSIFYRKWKIENGYTFSIFIFHWRWKIQNGQLKKPRKRQRISWSAHTIAAETVTYCQCRRSSEYYASSIDEDHILFSYLVKLHATTSGG